MIELRRRQLVKAETKQFMDSQKRAKTLDRKRFGIYVHCQMHEQKISRSVYPICRVATWI